MSNASRALLMLPLVGGLMDGFGLGETGGGVIEIDSSGHILSSIKKPLH